MREKLVGWSAILRLTSYLAINGIGVVSLSNKKATIEFESALGSHTFIMYQAEKPGFYYIKEMTNDTIEDVRELKQSTLDLIPSRIRIANFSLKSKFVK